MFNLLLHIFFFSILHLSGIWHLAWTTNVTVAVNKYGGKMENNKHITILHHSLSVPVSNCRLLVDSHPMAQNYQVLELRINIPQTFLG